MKSICKSCSITYVTAVGLNRPVAFHAGRVRVVTEEARANYFAFPSRQRSNAIVARNVIGRDGGSN